MIRQLLRCTTSHRCYQWSLALLIALFYCQSYTTAETKSGDKKPLLQGRESDLVHTFNTKGSVTSVEFSPNGRYLAAVTVYIKDANMHGFLYLWEVSKRKLIYSIPTETFQYAVAFSPDGTKLYSAGGLYDSDGVVLVWNSKTGRLLAKHKEEHIVQCLAVSPNGKTVVAGTMNYAVVLDARNAKVLRRLMGRAGESIVSIAYAPRGRLVVAGSDNNSLRVWNTEDGTLVQPESGNDRGSIETVVFAPDKRSFLTSNGKVVDLWNFHPLQIIQRFGGKESDPEFGVVSISSDSNLIAMSSGGTFDVGSTYNPGKRSVPILIWSWKLRRYVRPLQGHDGDVESLAFGGKRVLASGGADQCVRLWNISD
jgi:WD40 repeat protein